MRRLIFFTLVYAIAMLCFAGCQFGFHASAYYPEDGWKGGGDPYESRLAARGLREAAPIRMAPAMGQDDYKQFVTPKPAVRTARHGFSGMGGGK